MYRLYYAPNTYATPVHAVLEELGVAYELAPVDIRSNPRDPAYLKLNPNGKVPTLLDGGEPIFESVAIIIHLCDRHPEKGLAPTVGDPDRARFLQWLVHMATTIQPGIGIVYYPERYAQDAAATAVVLGSGVQRLLDAWSRIDAALAAKGPYLLGQRFSAADIYLALQATWDKDAPDLLTRFPAVARCARLAAQRPAVARVLAQHGIVVKPAAAAA
jgi:glutathione S-transferase